MVVLEELGVEQDRTLPKRLFSLPRQLTSLWLNLALNHKHLLSSKVCLFTQPPVAETVLLFSLYPPLLNVVDSPKGLLTDQRSALAWSLWVVFSFLLFNPSGGCPGKYDVTSPSETSVPLFFFGHSFLSLKASIIYSL